jgi:glutathione S-transferase
MKLYGTTTSPFVRRTRVVAQEVGETIELIDTATPEGMALLREVSPIRKVPVAVIEGRTIYDSREIIEWMTLMRGYGELTPPRDRWRQANLLNAIDAALDSVIQLFYLRRDGVAIAESPYLVRQLDRADAIFTWLCSELSKDRTSFGAGGLGVVEISVVCTLDWMDFRSTYPTSRAGDLNQLRAAWADRPSLATTKPHA